MRKFILPVITYIIVSFAWAYVWNLVLFKDAYSAIANSALRPEPIIPLGFVAIIIQALVITYLFVKIFPLAPSMKTAFTLTLGFGTFLITYAAFVVPAKFNISSPQQYMAMELVFEIIHFTIIALLFFSIFKNSKLA